MHRNYRSCENSCLTVTVNSNVYHEEDKMSTVAVQRSKTYDIVYIAVFAVIMQSVPGFPFRQQYRLHYRHLVFLSQQVFWEAREELYLFWYLSCSVQ